MKKLAILGASAVLAAMPVVGVFAADTTTVTDTIDITVDASCTLGITEGAKATKNVANGSKTEDLSGSSFSITCNDGSGWNVTAQAKAKNEGTAGSLTAVGGESIASNASFSETQSGWAFKLTGAHAEETYQKWAVVPSTATVVAKSSNTTSEDSLAVTYGVGIDATQAAGTYSGEVTYVLATGTGE